LETRHSLYMINNPVLRPRSYTNVWVTSLVAVLSFALTVSAQAHKPKHHRHHSVVRKTAVTDTAKKPGRIETQVKVEHRMPPPGHEGEERNNWFMMRRAWPNMEVDPTAYPTALAEAARMPVMYPRAGKYSSFTSSDWQGIGPYSIDGRITCIATHPTDSNTLYIGAAAGGLWKTTDHGTSWRCVTDTFGSLSIGCVTIDPVQPQTLYIGLGECNGSSDSYPGNGLWKSNDGGNTWSYLGFSKSQYIAKVLLDPANHNNIFLAVLGPNSLTDTNRGVFRSTDAGATWTRLLYAVNASKYSVGFIDIAIDPLNSAQLVAFANDKSITVASDFGPGGPGGPGTGIYRTIDTGHSWVRVDTMAGSGLPNGVKQVVLGRGALLWMNSGGDKKAQDYLFAAYVRADTNPVTHYLTDENFEGLYRSTNQGLTWSKILDSTIKIPMGGVQGKDSANITNAQGGYDFYMVAGPMPTLGYPDIYLGGIDVFRSTDLGATWKDITNSYSDYYVKGSRKQHSDQHGLAFTAAKAGNDLFVVSDGGIFHTTDYGTHWSQTTGLPITMFYAIEPWRGGMANTPSTISASDLKVFGGTQDNGTVGHGLTPDADFAWINHGDGEVAVSHPTDPNKLITSLQFGVIFARNAIDSLVPDPLSMRDTTHDSRPRWHTLTYRLLKAPHPLTDTEEAVAWTAPIALDENNTSSFYTGRCRVYRAFLDWNDLENTTWKTWSPAIEGDTAQDSRWYLGDIESIAIGPRDGSGNPMLWAGGYGVIPNVRTVPNIWRTTVDPTRNDTTPPHWIPVRNNLPSYTVSSIVPDRSDSLTAFVTLAAAASTGHVWRTTTGGKKWINISSNLPSTAPVSVLVIDTLNEHGDPRLKNQVLIIATDVGVFATTNGGAQWAQLGTVLPHVIISDLKIYKNMLIAATHGRSLYAIDISGLQGVPASVSNASANAAQSVIAYPNPIVPGTKFTVRMTNGLAASGECRCINEASGIVTPLPFERVSDEECTIMAPRSLSAGAYIIQFLDRDGIHAEGRLSIVR